MTGRRASSGMTLVELLVGIAMTGVFATALFSFFFASTETSRGHENQGRALAEGRRATALLASDLRQSIGLEPGESPPLASVNPTSVELYLDDRRDPAALEATHRKVRYALVGGQLVRESAVASGAPGSFGPYSGREVLVDRAVNGTAPLFTPRSVGGTALAGTLTTTAQLTAVVVIDVRLLVGYRRSQLDGSTEVRTSIALRNAVPVGG